MKHRKSINYDNIIYYENIIETYHHICNCTKHKQKLFNYDMFLMSNFYYVLFKLKLRKYSHAKYNIFLISEPKYRLIMSENISDKIVNHMISDYFLLPILDKTLIETNVATRIGKGTGAGFDYIKNYINNYKNKYDRLYVLKCDVKKYFYNINHEILMSEIKKKIDNEEVLSIIKNIVDSTDKPYINDWIKKRKRKEIHRLLSMNKVRLAKEVKKLPTYKKGFGLPIGNQTSQILAVFYLNGVDHFIKEELHIKCYVRYMDDLVIIHHDKEYLQYCLKAIEKKMNDYDLKLNDKTRIYSLDNGFNFLGYRYVLKNKKLIIKISNSTKKKVVKKLKNNEVENFNAIKASYKGFLENANTNTIIYKYF